MIRRKLFMSFAGYLLLSGSQLYADDLAENGGIESNAANSESEQAAPDMELLMYLGGWEINQEEAQEPLYWFESSIENSETPNP